MTGSPGTLAVAVVGAGGRMGSYACELLEGAPGFSLVAAYRSADNWPASLAASGARVALDLTVAGLGHVHGRAILESGVRPVVGTSGVTPDQARELDRRALALDLGGLVVPNFCVGMWLLQRAALEAARYLRKIEIVELHHAHKRDAPSGTASDTARRLERVLSEAGEHEPHVPIHSVRLPGLRAHQEVLLGGPGELLTLRHDALSPEAFGPGMLLALRHAATVRGISSGLDAVLEAVPARERSGSSCAGPAGD